MGVFGDNQYIHAWGAQQMDIFGSCGNNPYMSGLPAQCGGMFGDLLSSAFGLAGYWQGWTGMTLPQKELIDYLKPDERKSLEGRRNFQKAMEMHGADFREIA